MSGRRYGQFSGALAGSCVADMDGGVDAGVMTYSGCAKAIGGGAGHACAVVSDGTVQCWGAGGSGQIGDGLLMDEPLPTQVLDAQRRPLSAASLVLGGAHSCAISPAQTLSCWGANDHGQLGTGAPPSPQPVPALLSLNPVTAAAAGRAHTCASVGSAGLVWCWGENDAGEVGGAGPGGDENMPVPALAGDSTQLAAAVALAAGWAHTCALISGHVSCWGSNADGQLGGSSGRVNGLPAIRAIAANAIRGAALGVDGTVWTWGDGVATAFSVVGLSANAIAAGATHDCVVRPDGFVVCWGENDRGQLGDGTVIPKGQPVEIVDVDGQRVADVAEVIAGDGYSCARTNGGAVLCWGAAQVLGDGSNADRPRAGVVRLTCP